MPLAGYRGGPAGVRADAGAGAKGLPHLRCGRYPPWASSGVPGRRLGAQSRGLACDRRSAPGAGGLPRGRADSWQCRVRGEGMWDASDNRSVARTPVPSRTLVAGVLQPPVITQRPCNRVAGGVVQRVPARALPTLPWRSAGTLAAQSPTCWGCVPRRSTGPRNGAAPLGGGGRGCSQSARRERILGSNLPSDVGND